MLPQRGGKQFSVVAARCLAGAILAFAVEPDCTDRSAFTRAIA